MNKNPSVEYYGALVNPVEQSGTDSRSVQDFVRKVMEGGEEAFRRRAEKYGLEV